MQIIPQCSVLLRTTGWQQACASASKLMQICCSYRWAVTQHKCIAALYFASHSPGFSVALQNRLAASLCHCNQTYANLLFIKEGSDPIQMHCSIVSCQIIPQCSVLLCKTGWQQACVTAITPMQICSSYRWAVTQYQCTAALDFASHSPVLLCKTSWQQDCVTAVTPMKTCCSYRWAVTQYKCTAALDFVNHSPVLSLALQNRQAAGLCHCSYNYAKAVA